MTDKVILLEEIKEHLNNTTEVLNEVKTVGDIDKARKFLEEK